MLGAGSCIFTGCPGGARACVDSASFHRRPGGNIRRVFHVEWWGRRTLLYVKGLR